MRRRGFDEILDFTAEVSYYRTQKYNINAVLALCVCAFWVVKLFSGDFSVKQQTRRKKQTKKNETTKRKTKNRPKKKENKQKRNNEKTKKKKENRAKTGINQLSRAVRVPSAPKRRLGATESWAGDKASLTAVAADG